MIRNKENLIFENYPITKAIKILDKVKYKTLVIIDKKKKLLGTLTDGDIRRSILKGISLKKKVIEIAFIKPKKKILGKNFYLNNKKEHLDLVPVVDKNNQVVDINILKDNFINYKKKNKYKKITIIFMAGGFGKRLMPLTKNVPKPLLKIRGKTLLEIAIDNFKNYGFKDFFISVYYKSNIIKNFFNKKKFNDLKINYLAEKKPLGTAGCLSLLNYENIQNNILVYNADIITGLNINNFIKFHLDTNSDITVCAKEVSNYSPFGKILFKGHKVKKIIEKAKNTNFINAGIYLIKKQLIKNIKISKIDMTEFIDLKINQKKNVNIYPVYEYWTDVGRKEIFNRLKN